MQCSEAIHTHSKIKEIEKNGKSNKIILLVLVHHILYMLFFLISSIWIRLMMAIIIKLKFALRES